MRQHDGSSDLQQDALHDSQCITESLQYTTNPSCSADGCERLTLNVHISLYNTRQR